MVAVIRAKRSAIGKYNGMYKEIPLSKIGADLANSLVKDLKIDEVILGNVLSGNLGQNIARQVSVKSGLDLEIPSFTVNKVCGSGLKAVWLGMQSIIAGDNNTVLVGGLEKMTDSDFILKDGLTDAFSGIHMGITAENIVDMYNFSRKDLDDFSYNSQMKVKEAMLKNIFKEEIFDDSVDEYPRIDLEREKLDKLKPAFKEDGGITPGNASGINDGAAMLVLMNYEKAKKENQEILAQIKGFASYGCEPSLMGLAPVKSTQKLLDKFNLKVEDIDLFEVNEAFASVVLAFKKDLNIPDEKLNVNGGAISLGHPIGASGARILITLIYELRRRGLKRGIATLCIGGGQGISVLVEI